MTVNSHDELVQAILKLSSLPDFDLGGILYYEDPSKEDMIETTEGYSSFYIICLNKDIYDELKSIPGVTYIYHADMISEKNEELYRAYPIRYNTFRTIFFRTADIISSEKTAYYEYDDHKLIRVTLSKKLGIKFLISDRNIPTLEEIFIRDGRYDLLSEML